MIIQLYVINTRDVIRLAVAMNYVYKVIANICVVSDHITVV